jgi:exodeoxyribonuclease VII large subunit
MSVRPPKNETLAFDFGVFVPPAATAPKRAPAVPKRTAPVVEPTVQVKPVNVVEAVVAPPPAVVAAPAPAAGPDVLSVAQLGRVLSRTLERQFESAVWVEGEVAGARPAPSGHLYFTLKDEEEDATMDVVVYRAQVTPRARTLVKDGVRIRLRGKPTFWSPRGKLQFIGDRIEPTGKGALLEALFALKQKLQAEGLFAPEKKRALPKDPRTIGVVTSASGAVIHDICKVAFRRGGAKILLAPALVQGVGAADSVRRALAALQQVGDVDVIIVGRGGGSQDDLLAFHDEQLVRDVAACRVPVVSAVGHETDITLVDFAADARASTPSQAAELLVPDSAERRRLLAERAQRLHRAMHGRIAEERTRTVRLGTAFRDPRLLIASAQQRIDDHVARMSRAVSSQTARERDTMTRLAARLAASHPRARIARNQGEVLALRARMVELTRARLVRFRSATADTDVRLAASGRTVISVQSAGLSTLAGRLDAMSPLKVLARGYAIATRKDSGLAVREAREIAVGQEVHVRISQGSFEAQITKVNEP